MGISIFFWYDPWFHSIQDHIIDYHSISQMNWSLNTQNAKNIKLSGCEIVQKIVKFDVLTSRLNTLINGNDKLVCLIYLKISFSIHNGLDTWLNKLQFKLIQILKVIFLVHEIVFQWSNGAFHVKDTSFLSLQPHSTDSHAVSHDSLCCHNTKLLISL